jgi:hypothetical protein
MARRPKAKLANLNKPLAILHKASGKPAAHSINGANHTHAFRLIRAFNAKVYRAA